MSTEGHPVFSAGGPGNTKPGRVVYRTICEIHKLEYGRELVPATAHAESYLIGNCPKCLEDVRIRTEWQEKVSSLHAEVKAETDAQCEAESGRAERIAEMAFTFMDEDRAARFEEWKQKEDEHFAARQTDYVAYADSQDRIRIDAEIIEKRRLQFFEQQKSVAAQADAELQTKLDAEREQRCKESLSGWVTLG